MKIVAHQNHRVYLLDIGDDRGQVLDLDQKKLFRPFNIHSILTYSPWDEYTDSQNILPDLLAQVTAEENPPPPKRRSEAEIQQWLREKGFRS
ncbi:MAG: hypothetical protein GFH27_549279n338 [Chloroflexi bacterium AL-W]|nr:hypothetical protein [Chloroflexi bacterium AL-N1]NOK65304.1 hypothetical protein [Chloroflexi bacterium AL-N10]NOK72431.1 hypothetical protein [Chloroflexi bacterium AL-N5]NOK79483.1 hypothetical protein [Chloroflexi bacterium AL-W]NOK87399.1 hypothetical protein [Chloroflexi bacterium AL-N15]